MKNFLLFLGMAVIAAGCSNAAAPSQESVPAAAVEAEAAATVDGKEEESAQQYSSIVSSLAEELGCSERTAQSLCDEIKEITGKETAAIEVLNEDGLRFLKITAEDNSEYYAELSRGYFISSVYADSVDGERIYRAIQ